MKKRTLSIQKLEVKKETLKSFIRAGLHLKAISEGGGGSNCCVPFPPIDTSGLIDAKCGTFAGGAQGCPKK